MIFDELVSTTNSLKNLKKKTDLKNNKVMQNNTDTKYRVVLKQTNSFIDTIEFLYAQENISSNNEILSSLQQLLTSLEKAIESGMANQEEVVKAENSFKMIQVNMKKEWSKQYTAVSSGTISTLNVIRGIDADNVTKCMQKIQGAESWELGVGRYQVMISGLAEAKQLIVKLGLDDDIVRFLQNTNAGKATLKDLNEKVLKWIQSENLDGKIRISFIK